METVRVRRERKEVLATETTAPAGCAKRLICHRRRKTHIVSSKTHITPRWILSDPIISQ